MVDRIIVLLVSVFSAVSEWLAVILNATGTLSLVLGAIFLVLLLRYIISPIVGRGSDKVTKKRSPSNSSEDE